MTCTKFQFSFQTGYQFAAATGADFLTHLDSVIKCKNYFAGAGAGAKGAAGAGAAGMPPGAGAAGAGPAGAVAGAAGLLLEDIIEDDDGCPEM
jgi:hypothetical protein